MPLFNAMSPLNGGDLNDYYNPRAYPIDLAGGQQYMRPQTGMAVYPYPLAIGMVQGLCSQLNAMAFQLSMGKDSFGPWMGAPQGNLADVFPDITGGLPKVTG